MTSERKTPCSSATAEIRWLMLNWKGIIEVYTYKEAIDLLGLSVISLA